MRRAIPVPALSLALAFAVSACGGSRASNGPRPEPEAGAKPPPRDAHDAGAPGVMPKHDAAPPKPDARATHDAAPVTPAEPDGASETDGGGALDAGLCRGTGSRFATSSPEHAFGPGQSNGQDQFPALVLGPPKGGGACMGSTDVVSFGNGGYVVLEFAGNAIVDGPGPDFIVFENPFGVGCDMTKLFAELGTVSVSNDLTSWTDFPCTANSAPYGECSGFHPVFANADTNEIDPTDPATAGGDPYDLADIGVKEARYVRITDRADLTGMAGVYDLDAVAIVNAACP
jgi:hypothetical protein